MHSFCKLLLAASLLLGGQVQAQTFEPGYLVTAAGDTLRGELENRFWQEPPTGVVFRAGADQAVQSYVRTQLQSFQLNSGRYFRREVLPVDRAATRQLSNLPSRLIINQQPDTLLAEVVVDGPAPLLRAVLADVNHFFVQRPGQPFLELTEHRYLATVNGQERVMDGNNYKEQLRLYFADCPAAVAAVKTASFSTRGLVQVVQAFNAQCSIARQAAPDLMTASRQQLAFNGGVLAAGRYNRLMISTIDDIGEEPALLNGLNLDGRLQPVGGLYLDILTPGRRWLVHSEAAFSTYGRRGMFAVAGDAGSYIYTWHGTRLDVRLGARRLFGQQGTQALFAGGGIDFDITTSSESGASYGGGSSRLTVRNVRVPSRSAFIGSSGLNIGPYLETGLRRGRATLSIDVSLLGSINFNDRLLVQSALRDSNNPTKETNLYNGYTYRHALLTSRLVLAWQLNRPAR